MTSIKIHWFKISNDNTDSMVISQFFFSRKTGKHRKHNTHNSEQHKNSWFGKPVALEQEFINTDEFFQ